ncbi:MAG: glycosyltransferase [Clostridia bacterium]|nr:glycosyltransferase [Clostridia bacterium]
MKKVLIIAGALHIGGAEKVCRDIGLFAKGRCEVHYLVFGDRVGEYEEELTEVGCKVLHTAPPANGHKAYYDYLVRLIRQERYDVIHSHTMFNSGWAMLAARRCGVPVRIAHSHSALEVPMPLYKKCYEALMRRMILKNATVYAACGQKAGERLYGKKAFESKGVLLINGIQTAAFAYDEAARERVRRKHGLEGGFVIGHVGHLADVKNQSFLIKMMPKLLLRRPDARLLMLGEGSDRQMLETLIEQFGLKERVLMTGNVRNVNEYLSAMDVFAFPSLYEGLPLSIVEVQANGLPCIISDRVPKDVFVTDLLRTLPLDNADEWVDAICSARRNNSEEYCSLVRMAGMDVRGFMEKVYSLYGV